MAKTVHLVLAEAYCTRQTVYHSFHSLKMAQKSADQAIQITGWILFIGSALFFTASTVKSGDVLGVGGSLLFLMACFVFLWPLLRDRA